MAKIIPTPDATEPAFPAHIVGSIAEVANFARVSVRTVGTWIERGMPGERGHYDLADVFAWVRINVPVPHSVAKAAGSPLKEKPVDRVGHSLDDLEREKLDIANARAELRYKRERGELVNRAAVAAAFGQHIATAAARLDSLPNEIGSSIAPEIRTDIVAEIKQKIDMVRSELARPNIPELKEVAKLGGINVATPQTTNKRK